MKALLLAGGTGSRLGALTYATNKHLLPVGDKPMIIHSFDFLHQVGIDEVLVITGHDAVGPISSLVNHYHWWDYKVQYAIQHAPLGIADAIKYGQRFCGRSRFLVLLGDNIISQDHAQYVRNSIKYDDGDTARIWTVKLPDASQYGVLNLDNAGNIVGIKEKPVDGKDGLAIIGCYVFSECVWDITTYLSPSHRGEYEIIDILKWYCERGKLKYGMYSGRWADMGSSSALYYAELLKFLRDSK